MKGETTDLYREMANSRTPIGDALARQALLTTASALPAPVGELRVLDIGCGYGATALALGARCATVVGIEPFAEIAAAAAQAAGESANVSIVRADILTWKTDQKFDLVILDNVYEHIADHRRLVAQMLSLLAPGGVFYVVVPNKLWPIEVHYHLPFLSYLPLRVANAYLRASGRGDDYTDASYAPTFWSIQRDFAAFPELAYEFTLPADLALTEQGASPLYRAGAWLIGRHRMFWALSKAFVIVGRRL
jgi:SAM-dependent methyltransferase